MLLQCLVVSQFKPDEFIIQYHPFGPCGVRQLATFASSKIAQDKIWIWLMEMMEWLEFSLAMFRYRLKTSLLKLSKRQ